MLRMSCRLMMCAVVAAAAITADAAAVQASTFSASAAAVGASGSTPQQVLDATYSGPGGTGLASAIADRGILRAKAFIQSVAGCFCTPNISGGAVSLVYATDVVISGPGGPASVPATVHVVLDGNLDATGPNPWTATKVSMYVSGPDNVTHSGYVYLSGGVAAGVDLLAGIVSNSFSFPIDVDLGLVPVGTPFTIVFYLGAQADGSSWHLTYNTGTADSFTSGGLHFPGNPPPVLNALPESAGPVFTLPAGYTSNIPSMNVVDNYWTGAATRTRPGTWGSVKSLYRR